MWATSGEQLEQHSAERIDVGCGGQRVTTDLLGACVLRSEGADIAAREGQRVVARVRAYELGDAEIEQLRGAVGGDQDVAGFDVAVNHQIFVRVLHRVAQLAEEREPVVDRGAAGVAPGGDRFALDVLHDQKRPAVGGDAAVEQRRDVGVLEIREDLSLATESGERELGIQSALDQLDRDPLSVFVGPHSFVDRAHAAHADDADDLVRAEALADEAIGLGLAVVDTGGEWGVKGDPWLVGGRDQLLDLLAGGRVPRGGVREKGVSLCRGLVHGRVKELADTAQPFRCVGHRESKRGRVRALWRAMPARTASRV